MQDRGRQTLGHYKLKVKRKLNHRRDREGGGLSAKAMMNLICFVNQWSTCSDWSFFFFFFICCSQNTLYPTEPFGWWQICRCLHRESAGWGISCSRAFHSHHYWAGLLGEAHWTWLQSHTDQLFECASWLQTYSKGCSVCFLAANRGPLAMSQLLFEMKSLRCV